MMNKLFLIIGLVFIFGCNQNEKVGDPNTIYICSMDPQVMENKPGNCPICKMPLTAVKKSTLPHAGEIKLSDQQIKLGNIKTGILKGQTMHNSLSLTGTLSENKNKSEAISSWIKGRIEKLYYKSTGEKIRVGEPLYEIYSEELNLIIKELKLAYEKKINLNNNSPEMERIIMSTRNKLLLYGLTEKQIDKYITVKTFPENITILSKNSGVITSVDINEGSYVMEGGHIYHLADYATLWAEAEIYTDDLEKIHTGMEAYITIPEIPSVTEKGTISFVNPELNSSTKISLLRVVIPNKNNLLKPGMQVNFSVVLNEFSAAALPTDAILLDEKGATVWIKTGKNTYKSKMIKTGIESNNYTEVVSGLKPGDIVVISGTYLLNSEYLFRKGTSPMEGHDMNNM